MIDPLPIPIPTLIMHPTTKLSSSSTSTGHHQIDLQPTLDLLSLLQVVVVVVKRLLLLLVLILLPLMMVVEGTTDSGDVAVLRSFEKGLSNPELLKWPHPSLNNDPCSGPPLWNYVFCNNNQIKRRVTQIQVQNMGLKGTLPPNLNSLTQLNNLGLQRNAFTGTMPSLSGLSSLQFAFLGTNQFDSIPSDFFDGLSSLQILSLEHNPNLNRSSSSSTNSGGGGGGWSLPPSLPDSSPQLQKLYLTDCNLIGSIPESLPSQLQLLQLSFNRLSGPIPDNIIFTANSQLEILWVNNNNNQDQYGGGLTGTLDAVAKIPSLHQAWLHGNKFSGPIPTDFANLPSLSDLRLSDNQLVGIIPQNLTTNLPSLTVLKVDNNPLTGPLPEFDNATLNFTYAGVTFCNGDKPGAACAPQVSALLQFLSALDYPLKLARSWVGNDPCQWTGIACNSGKAVVVINLPNYGLNGTVSASLANLTSLTQIVLTGNHLIGVIPAELTTIKSLTVLNLASNNISPPIPEFSENVKLDLSGNLLFSSNRSSSSSPSPGTGGSGGTVVGAPPNSAPASSSPQSGNFPPPNSTPASTPQYSDNAPSLSPNYSPQSNSSNLSPSTKSSAGNNNGLGNNANENLLPNSDAKSRIVILSSVATAAVFLVLLGILLLFFIGKRTKRKVRASSNAFVIHPRDPSDPNDIIKIALSNGSPPSLTNTGSESTTTNGYNSRTHVIDTGDLMVSVQILRRATRNFAPNNELGRGGFGTVYKGELDDGTMIAVKRMEAAVVTNKALDEFRAEIEVLSKVRHRHLVLLFGYCIEGYEKLLVYEYMSQGALSKHVFQWKKFNMEPLSWKRRVIIALDVARGMEYLHNLAHRSFIHRDLKSSNILLDDNFRAKVSDFGLVKLAPDDKNSVATRLAGTFGYLAPEYAVTGKVTTKADVFSFGVVLMELVTGLMALDEERSEESRYLASWFWQIKMSREALDGVVDPAIDVSDATVESISTVAELARHCTSREPNQRPDMSHVVSVLAPLVEQWKPTDEDEDEFEGITYDKSLLQMVKGWQANESANNSMTATDDSKGSIPARPTGFAESFTSADGR